MKINGYEIKNISKEQLATYLNIVFQSISYRDLIINSKNINDVYKRHCDIGELLVTYLITTGDFSLSTANKIINDYNNHCDELNIKSGNYISRFDLNNKDKYFKNYILKHIINYWTPRLNLSSPLTVEDNVKLQEIIKEQSVNNIFYTYSFNGAIYDIINSDGININCKEQKILNKLFNDEKLCLYQICDETFNSSLKAPLNLHNYLKGDNVEIKDDETLNEYYKRCLNDISNDNETKKQLEQLIDYYFTNSISCIAITNIKKETINRPNLRIIMYNNIVSLKRYILAFISEDKLLEQKYTKLINCLKNPNIDYVDELTDFKNYFNETHGCETILDKKLEDSFIKIIMDNCLNKFSYKELNETKEIENGVLKRNDISIIKFNNPVDIYVNYNKEKNKQKIYKK